MPAPVFALAAAHFLHKPRCKASQPRQADRKMIQKTNLGHGLQKGQKKPPARTGLFCGDNPNAIL